MVIRIAKCPSAAIIGRDLKITQYTGGTQQGQEWERRGEQGSRVLLLLGMRVRT